MTNNFNIKGHSGCTIEVKKDVVVKSASTKKYSERLYLQHNKQINFNDRNIKAPTIYNSGKLNGCFWFEMERIPFSTFDSFMLMGDKKALDRVAKKIIKFINKNIIGIKKIDKNIIIKKYEKTKDNIFIKHGIDLNYLNSFFYNLDKDIFIPEGYCHGDLTFSNMLFDNSDIAFIDFLDTFLESPLQDIVKIRQDTKYFWSLNLLNEIQDNLKIKQSLNYIDTIIENEFIQKSWYKKCYNYFQALNLLRIIPYSQNYNHIDKLINETKILCLH